MARLRTTRTWRRSPKLRHHLVGPLLAAGAHGPSCLATLLDAAAVFFAKVNVVRGYLVTDRMLGMFKKRPDRQAAEKPEA